MTIHSKTSYQHDSEQVAPQDRTAYNYCCRCNGYFKPAKKEGKDKQ